MHVALALGSLGGALALAAIYLAFYVTPTIVTEADQADYAQKIFYLHTPIAMTSLISFVVAAVAGVMFLATRRPKWDIIGRIAIELGLLYGLLVMYSGMIWDRAEWGVWWTWDPKLTVYLIALLFFSAYFVLRSSVEEPEARARFAAVYAIVGSVSAPMTFFVNRVLPAVHPVLFKLGQQVDQAVMTTFLTGIFGMMCIYAALMITRYTIEEAKDSLAAVKDRMES